MKHTPGLLRFSARQSRDLVFSADLPPANKVPEFLRTLRMELRSYRLPNGTHHASPVVGGFKASYLGKEPYIPTCFIGEPRPTYLDAIRLLSHKHASSIVHALVQQGYPELIGVRILLSGRKTVSHAGFSSHKENKIALYWRFQNVASLLHESAHMVLEKRHEYRGHGSEFQDLLLNLWSHFE